VEEDEVTYPLKFRQHVLKIRGKEGLSFCQAARRFGVGIARVMRWARKIEPVAVRHRRAQKIDGQRLMRDVADYPDAYLCERAERFGVSRSGMGKALKRLGLSRKKNTMEVRANNIYELVVHSISEGRSIGLIAKVICTHSLSVKDIGALLDRSWIAR
jgi:transposase